MATSKPIGPLRPLYTVTNKRIATNIVDRAELASAVSRGIPHSGDSVSSRRRVCGTPGAAAGSDKRSGRPASRRRDQEFPERRAVWEVVGSLCDRGSPRRAQRRLAAGAAMSPVAWVITAWLIGCSCGALLGFMFAAALHVGADADAAPPPRKGLDLDRDAEARRKIADGDAP